MFIYDKGASSENRWKYGLELIEGMKQDPDMADLVDDFEKLNDELEAAVGWIGEYVVGNELSDSEANELLSLWARLSFVESPSAADLGVDPADRGLEEDARGLATPPTGWDPVHPRAR